MAVSFACIESSLICEFFFVLLSLKTTVELFFSSDCCFEKRQIRKENFHTKDLLVKFFCFWRNLYFFLIFGNYFVLYYNSHFIDRFVNQFFNQVKLLLELHNEQCKLILKYVLCPAFCDFFSWPISKTSTWINKLVYVKTAQNTRWSALKIHCKSPDYELHRNIGFENDEILIHVISSDRNSELLIW